MDPGQVPEIRPVTRYPGQGHVGADCKIPTEIWYDEDGNVRAVGAEANREGIEDIAEDEGWTKAKWFKLHMRPRGQRGNLFTPALPPLPRNKTVIRVFADFLKYLFECAKAYIQETHAGGTTLWGSVADEITYVLTHPNGWEGPQQAQMREAAVLAGLISNNSAGRSRVTFVTEGEASLHFCINNGLAPDALEKGEGIIIVDAGGGTIDISAYQGRGAAFHETAIPQCHFQGSIFVTTRAKVHLEGLLRDSNFEDDIPHIVQLFDKGAKLSFKDDTSPHYVKFGRTKDTDMDLGIRNGQLRLQGSVVAKFFAPSISCIAKAVKEQVRTSVHPITRVFLVGGFAASDWLYTGVKKELEQEGLEVSRPDSHVNKAVSDGAAAFHLDHYVESRVSRACFGIIASILYDPFDSAHRARARDAFIDPISKEQRLMHFSPILPKNQQVSETKEYRKPYSRIFEKEDDKHGIQPFGPILRYSGQSEGVRFLTEEPHLYSVACQVLADIGGVNTTTNFNGINFYEEANFDIILRFGLTELQAQIAWVENGVEKRSPAEVIHEAN